MAMISKSESIHRVNQYLSAREAGLYLNDFIRFSTHDMCGVERRALAAANSMSCRASGVVVGSKSMSVTGPRAEVGMSTISPIGAMVDSIRSQIRSKRADAAYVDHRTVIDIRLERVRSLAHGALAKSKAAKTTKSTPVIKCRKPLPLQGRIQVQQDGGLVYLPPTWEAKVYNEGIAIADMVGNDKCLVVTAERQSSAFLREMGVTHYEVTAMRIGVKAKALQGYAFKVNIGGTDVAVYHDNFNRGASLISAMIEDAFHAELEKVQ